MSKISMNFNKPYVEQWVNSNTDAVTINKYLDDSGNKIQFSFLSVDDSVHVYLGVDSSGILNATVIPTDGDTITNGQCIGIESFNTTKEALPVFVPIGNDPDSISWDVANSRINLWMDATARTAYVNQSTASSEGPLVLSFYVNEMDFPSGNVHYGYLGLIETTVGGVTVYTPDLIIRSVAPEGTYLEDLANPVPPWKHGTVAAKQNFGLYNQINY